MLAREKKRSKNDDDSSQTRQTRTDHQEHGAQHSTDFECADAIGHSAEKPAPPVTTTIHLSKTWKAADLAPFDLAPGDSLDLELITDTPRAGETIALKKKERDNCTDFGKLVEFYTDEEDGAEWFQVIGEDGKQKGYERELYNLWRIKFVTRHTPYSHDDEARKTKKERKLDALRRRLDRLNRDGDITDSTARFKLEKQIYDLENQPANEWEGFDVVDEGGAR
jgi:hypothetical protein